MNRAARRLTLFARAQDYDAFVKVLRDASVRMPMRVLGFVVMPTHWHLILWPEGPDDLSRFMAWVTGTHSRWWHLAHGSAGTGTIYQGRFKAIAVKDDHHLLTVCRYVECNPVRADLSQRPDQWRWSSASRPPHPHRPPLHPWPVPRPASWDEQEPAADLERLRAAIRRNTPFGSDDWSQETARHLGWSGGHAHRGRPRKAGNRRHTTVGRLMAESAN